MLRQITELKSELVMLKLVSAQSQSTEESDTQQYIVDIEPLSI